VLLILEEIQIDLFSLLRERPKYELGSGLLTELEDLESQIVAF